MTLLQRVFPYLCLVAVLPAQERNVFPGDRLPARLKPFSPERREGAAAIDSETLRKWLARLASREFEGRATGTPGYEKAARYVAGKFREFGLSPAGEEGGFFQPVPFVELKPLPEESRLTVLDGEEREVLRIGLGEGFSGRISSDSDLSFRPVFLVARKGEDYRDLSLEGKAVVLVDRGRKTRWGSSEAVSRLWRKRIGCLFLVDEERASLSPKEGGLIRFAAKEGAGGRRSARNRYYLTMETAKRLAEAAGLSGAALSSSKSWTGLPKRPVTFHLRIRVESKKVFAANVLGILEGTDPEASAEILGLGAHLDHLGTREDGTIYYGADDDASGVTALLAVAKAFTTNPRKPRRSILFMAFCGEEMGLIGSAWFTDHPAVRLDRMVAELQMEMVGRREENLRTGEKPEDNLNTLHLVGSRKLSGELHRICLEQNRAHIGFSFEFDEERLFSRSDQLNFARKNIPVVFFFAGFHPQNHTPRDTIDRIDFAKLVRVAKLVYAVAFEIADRKERIVPDRTWKEVMGGRRRR